jgi:hypothetical protein
VGLERFLQTRTVYVKSDTTKHQGAGRKTTSPEPKKGGDKRVSRESWRSLRAEVATWP